ncbi:MAG: glycosyltransferase family 4 protein, partial [Sphingomonas sp.]
MKQRPTVIILLGAYWPGNASSGPNQTIRAICAALSDHFDFRVIARDRPFDGARAVAEGGKWHDHDVMRVRYLEVGRAGAKGLAKLLRETPHDLLMLNGFFDREFTIPALIARRLGRIPRRPTILSPRGEFSEGALSLKAGRKSFYRMAMRLTGLLSGVRLHATSPAEESDMCAAFPNEPIRHIANFRDIPALPAFEARAPGAPLRIAFLGRISPVKGVEAACLALARVTSSIAFDLYGPISDAPYWKRCQQVIAELPTNVTVAYRGELANDAVVEALAEYDLMFMPSHSENFGHAILEALAAGTPVLIGDKTPWRNL